MVRVELGSATSIGQVVCVAYIELFQLVQDVADNVEFSGQLFLCCHPLSSHARVGLSGQVAETMQGKHCECIEKEGAYIHQTCTYLSICALIPSKYAIEVSAVLNMRIGVGDCSSLGGQNHDKSLP